MLAFSAAERAAAGSPQPSAMALLRLASYNVHRAIGRDRKCDPERILERAARDRRRT